MTVPEPGDAAIGPGAGVEPAVAAPAGEGGTGPTGHPAVDAALGELAQAADRPLAEQVAAYEAAHRTLAQTLATIDQS